MTWAGSAMGQAGVVALVGLWAVRVLLLKFVRGWVALEAAALEAVADRFPVPGWVAQVARRGAERRRRARAQASGCAAGCGTCRSSRCQGSDR